MDERGAVRREALDELERARVADGDLAEVALAQPHGIVPEEVHCGNDLEAGGRGGAFASALACALSRTSCRLSSCHVSMLLCHRKSRNCTIRPVDERRLPHEWRTSETRDLFEAILSLRTVDEAERFFRDLCTLSELEAMAHRWQVARLLDEGCRTTRWRRGRARRRRR